MLQCRQAEPIMCWQHAEMPSGRLWLKGRHRPHGWQRLGLRTLMMLLRCGEQSKGSGFSWKCLISWFSGVTSGESLPHCQERWDGPGQRAEVRAVDLHLCVENELFSRVQLCVKSGGWDLPSCTWWRVLTLLQQSREDPGELLRGMSKTTHSTHTHRVHVCVYMVD